MKHTRKGQRLTRRQAVSVIRKHLRGWKWGERAALARYYGVSPQLINEIVHRRKWASAWAVVEATK